MSIAVGLNNTQAASGAGQLSATFLNSTALGDILKDFNLSARPTEWIDTFLGPNRTAPFWRIPGLLSSPSPSPSPKPPGGPSRSPAPPDVDDVPGPPSTRDKGFYAAIAVAITVATAALIGLIIVIIKRRPSAAAQQRDQKAGGVEMTSNGAAGGAGQGQRRRVSGGWQPLAQLLQKYYLQHCVAFSRFAALPQMVCGALQHLSICCDCTAQC